MKHVNPARPPSPLVLQQHQRTLPLLSFLAYGKRPWREYKTKTRRRNHLHTLLASKLRRIRRRGVAVKLHALMAALKVKASSLNCVLPTTVHVASGEFAGSCKRLQVQVGMRDMHLD